MAMDWELAEFGVDYARGRGAQFAEARMEGRRVEALTLRNGVLDNVGSQEDRGIGFRVLVDGAMAFASTSLLTRARVEEALDGALAAAKATRRRHPLALAHAKAAEVRWGVEAKRPFADVPVEERLQSLLDLDGAIQSLGLETPGRLLEVSLRDYRRYLVTSEGARIRSEVPRIFFSAMLTAKDGSKTENSFRWLNYTGGWEGMEELGVDKIVLEDVEAMHRTLREAEKLPPGKMDIVCGPQVTGIASHESCGHPVEADRILGREASQAGMSFITSDMIGERIGSDLVNVVDDPTVAHGGGYYQYDDEGIRARKRYLYKDGLIHGFLQDRGSAGVLGGESNGAARTVAFNREPIVRMANTFVEPGDHSFEELVEGVERGVYIATFTEWNIDDKRWNQKYVGREAYLIEDGEVGRPVRAPVLEVTTRGFWSAVDAVGKDFYLEGGLCGKGDPMQGIEVSMGGPHIRLRGLHLG